LSENLKGTDYLVDLGEDGKKILKWILKKQVLRVWAAFIWLRINSIGSPLLTW
jgi:hypothetical protein